MNCQNGKHNLEVYCEGPVSRCTCGLAFCRHHLFGHMESMDEADHEQDVLNFESLCVTLG